MSSNNARLSSSIRLIIFSLFLPMAVLALILFAATSVSSLSAAEIDLPVEMPGEVDPDPAVAQVVTPTSLSVAILSTPWAVLDSNNPGGSLSDPAPNVFVVEAVVTNTGDYDAVDLGMNLDYNEDPANHWTLLPNETTLRTPASDLAPGESFYTYWFVTYPITASESHQYTVTAWSEGVTPVSTSTNFFGDPSPGATVTTDSFLSTGNSGVTEINANIVVGVVYTVTVSYDLGTNPQYLILSPVGNPNFDAGSTRLLASSVRLYNAVDPTGLTIYDRLYLPSIPDVSGSPPEFAEVTYTLLPVTPASTEICSFAAVGFSSTQKYDQFYCDPNKGTIFTIEGALSFSMTKQVDSAVVQQDGVLTYTINYTNSGGLPLKHVWVWDDLDPALASVISGTATPAADTDESNAHRVAWFLGDVAAAGETGASGTLTFQAVVDGAGVDLLDGAEALNQALFGVNPGSLPPLPALTATASSTIQAPVISLTKSDGHEVIGNGQTMTYTINVANSGSVAATNVILTDVLPSGVTPSGPASPPADTIDGQTLVWSSLADLDPGQMLTATIPVAVGVELPSFLDLVNNAYFEYSNNKGYTFDLITASDTTQVQRQAGFVDGHAFVDIDGDGFFDDGEPPQSGVQVSLPSALTPITTTNSAGYYRFRIEVEQPISVTAGLPAGYFHTTPGTVILENTFDVTNTVDFGYASTSSPFGVLYGTVFADDNHDGGQDGGENGLPGVTISATAALTNPVLTGAYGIYTLRFDDPGTVTVQESNPAGYVSTTPDLIQTDVVTGSDNASPLNFGDFLGIRVEGKVFDDLNVNGQYDIDPTEEPGVSGAQVTAGGDSFTTTIDGLFTLYARVPGGPILVAENDPAGYVSTDAVPGFGMSRVDANTLSIGSPISGSVYQGGLFGDISAAAVITISGEVWDDNGAGGGLAANGQRDGAEPGLAGVSLSASSGMSTETDGAGQFTLYAPPGVPVTVTEQNPAGYISTNAIPGDNAVKIDNDSLLITGLGAGQSSTGNQFGDAQETSVAAFSGFVWNDDGANGALANDGLWQTGQEEPLAGALVSLSSGMSVTTGLDGAFLLFGPPGAAITITEQNPADYVSSGASAGTGAAAFDVDTIVVDAPAAAQLYADNNFGDLLPADLTVAKLDDPDPVIAGTLLTYTLNLANDGPSYAQSVVISDVLPAGLTYVGVLSQPAEVSGPTVNGATLTWTATALDSGFSGSIAFQVAAAPDLAEGHILTNTASLASNMPDLAPASNDALAETTVQRRAALAISKSDDPDPATAGQQLTYSLQVDNNGPSDATGVSVTDALPAGLTYAASGASQGSYDPGAGLWTIGALAVGQSASLTITADIDPGLTGTITNTATVSGDQFDPQQGDNQADQATEIIAAADMAISKSDSPDPVTAGTELTYVVEIQNLGPSDASGVLVDDPLADGLTFQWAVASQGAYSETTGLWDVGLLPLNHTAKLTITVLVDSDQLGVVDNTATVGADSQDPDGENNSATVSTEIVASADLAISKADVPDPVAAGGVVTYTLSYQNLGPSDALAVSIVDSLSEDVTFLAVIAADPAAGSFQQNGQQLTWTFASLAVGESGSIVFTVRVGPDVIGAVFNDVAISSETDDPALGNNSAQSETAIGSPDQATIYGYVYADLNINGQFDPAEAGIAGVQVWLDDTYSTTTAASGLFFFITDLAGPHKVTEVDPANYFSTTSNKRVVSVSLGASKRVDFGDAPDTLEAAAIFGTVFNDTNSNGLWEDLEGGLPGVTVTLDSAVTAVTDLYGGYTFSVTVTGTHTVVETDPPYYFSTTPNTAEVEVEFGNGYEENFGDVRADIATCDPDQYEDDDVVHQAAALPVGESQRHDFCDDAVDWTVFSARAGFIYTITTSSFDWRVDTGIALFDYDGQTLIAANDDLPGNSDFSSSLTWQANRNEEFFIRASNLAAVTGQHTEYDITIEALPRYIRFVPLITTPEEAKDVSLQSPFRHAGRLDSMALPDADGAKADYGQAVSGYGPLGIIMHSCPDAYEVDDTWQTAFMVEDGDVQVHSFDSDPILWAADKDYMGFMLLPHQTITFTISATTNTDTFIEAFDHHGNSLGVTGTNLLVLSDMRQGHYYISVSPLNASGYGCAGEVGYEITVDKSPRWAMNVPVILKP